MLRWVPWLCKRLSDALDALHVGHVRYLETVCSVASEGVRREEKEKHPIVLKQDQIPRRLVVGEMSADIGIAIQYAGIQDRSIFPTSPDGEFTYAHAMQWWHDRIVRSLASLFRAGQPANFQKHGEQRFETLLMAALHFCPTSGWISVRPTPNSTSSRSVPFERPPRTRRKNFSTSTRVIAIAEAPVTGPKPHNRAPCPHPDHRWPSGRHPNCTAVCAARPCLERATPFDSERRCKRPRGGP